MPKIAMCPSEDCPARAGCYRNEANGTRPNPWRQAWSTWDWRPPTDGDAPVDCEGYWPDPTVVPPAARRIAERDGA